MHISTFFPKKDKKSLLDMGSLAVVMPSSVHKGFSWYQAIQNMGHRCSYQM